MNERDQRLTRAIVARLQQDLESMPSEHQQSLDAARAAAVAEASQVAAMRQSLQRQEQLPAAMQDKLDRARRAAVSQDRGISPGWLQRFSALGSMGQPAIGMTAAACLTLVMASVLWLGSAEPEQLTAAEDLALIASAEDIELYENLDFYLWLEETEQLN